MQITEQTIRQIERLATVVLKLGVTTIVLGWLMYEIHTILANCRVFIK